MAASAAGGDVRMIAAARSCFSNHRFDGGTTDCLRCRSFLTRFARLVRRYLVPGVVIAFSLLARVRIMPRRGVLCVPIVGGSWCRIRPGRRSSFLIISSSRAAGTTSFSSSLVPVSSPRRYLFSSGLVLVRRTADVSFHQSFPSHSY